MNACTELGYDVRPDPGRARGIMPYDSCYGHVVAGVQHFSPCRGDNISPKFNNLLVLISHQMYESSAPIDLVHDDVIYSENGHLLRRRVYISLQAPRPVEASDCKPFFEGMFSMTYSCRWPKNGRGLGRGGLLERVCAR